MSEIKILPLADWELSSDRPFVVAGPCSAESEEQVLKIASQLDKDKVQLFRAGIWKPRTRPNAFEGVGSIGLKWLQTVKKEYGFKITTEVANVKHVYEALKAGVDVLWIGARTTTNPFAVQEIADALQGVDIPVFVKNPVNPDLELWIGAIERIHQAGINRIGAIHRGFSSYGKSKYRNIPHWQIAIDLKRRLPEVALINDPSHITGNSDLIEMVSQKAMDLNFDGLMIETHNEPSKAWSDAKQQITPFHLHEILNRLVLRDELMDEALLPDTLEELRAKIDQLDNDLLDSLMNRMDVVGKIGEWKKKNNISIYQSSRFEDILEAVREKAISLGLKPEFAEIIFKAIHEESISLQTSVLNTQFEQVKK